MLRCGLIDNIMKLFKTKQKKIYQTAKPSTKHEEKAERLLEKEKITEEVCKQNNIKYSDLHSIIAYLYKYGYIKLKKYDANNPLELEQVSASFSAVPWMAKRHDDYYVGVIDFLIKEKIVCIKTIVNEVVLCLENGIAYYDKLSLFRIDNEFKKICSCVKSHSGRDIVLKMSVFHARSFTNINGENSLLKLIKQNPKLKLEILCVGKSSGEIAWEGADRKQLNNAIKSGMLKLYNLAYWYRSQVKMRVVRDKKADTALRCSVIVVDDEIEKCYFHVWRYGQERANYGITYEAPNDSSLALQVNQLFDDAFERAIPAKRNFEWFLYWFKKGFKFICMLLILTALQYLMLERTGVSAGEDSNNALVIFFSLTITIVVERIISGLGERFGN